LKRGRSARKSVSNNAFGETIQETTMQLIHHNPWELMSSLRRDISRLRQADAPESFVPAVDIYEEAGRFVVLSDLPGIDAAQIAITVEQDLLTIKGERKPTPTAEGASLQRAERASGSFERVFRLPETAAGEGIQADYRDGVLKVSIPKAEKPAPYRIEVTAN
jgi:HSP20 family protein